MTSLIAKVQDHLVACHMAGHSGDFVFVCCRKGFEKYLGRETVTGELIEFDVCLTELLGEKPCPKPLKIRISR